MPNYVLDSSAASVNSAINKVVNITEQPTAGNDNTVKSSGVKTYVDNAIASALATQLADIKAGFRPKFAPFGSGTHNGYINNQTSGTVFTYQMNAFTAHPSYTDFSYTKITHLVVDAYTANAHNYIEVFGTLPDGQYTRLSRTAAYAGGDNVDDATTTLLPVNPGQASVSFKTVYHTYGGSHWHIRGFMYLPGLD